MKWWLIGAAVIVLLPLISFFVMGVISWKRPELGLKEGKLSPCPESPNCVCSQSDENDEHPLQPINFVEGTEEANRDRLIEILQGISRNNRIEKTENYLHYEFVSGLFRFVDDVEFLFDAESRVIHVRSASRVGHSDLGVNRARVEKIRTLFQD